MDKKCETKKKKSLSTFAKEHKKEMAIGALTIGTIVTGIVIYKKCNIPLKEAMAYSDNLCLGAESVKERIPDLLFNTEIVIKNDIDNNPVSRIINVQEYIRKLPKDYNHSKKALELAAEYGYNLLDNETFVRPYSYLKPSA